MSTRSRPLSPHLQIYKLPLLAKLSISHRISGVGLAIGSLLLAYWLGSAAYSPEAYERAQGLIGSFPGYVALFAWSLAVFYHLSNGVRHLIWDAGHGFDLPTANASSRLVLLSTVVLTVLAWIIGLSA